MVDNRDILKEISGVIESRKSSADKNSYVASLFSKGRSKIAQKIGEEAVELSIAGVLDDKKAAISESADLLFHMLVLWSDMDIKLQDIYAELERREGKSGIDEKKSRKDK